MINLNVLKDDTKLTEQGKIDITYKELRDRIGEPHVLGEHKHSALWIFQTDNGIKISFRSASTFEHVGYATLWNICGMDVKALELAHALFPGHNITPNPANKVNGLDKTKLKLK